MGEPEVAAPGRRGCRRREASAISSRRASISFNRALRCFMQARASPPRGYLSGGGAAGLGGGLGRLSVRGLSELFWWTVGSASQATKRLHSTWISVVERKIKGVGGGGMQQAGSVKNASLLEVRRRGRLQFVTFDIATVVCRWQGRVGRGVKLGEKRNTQKKKPKQRLREEFSGPLQRAGPLGCCSRERFPAAK